MYDEPRNASVVVASKTAALLRLDAARYKSLFSSVRVEEVQVEHIRLTVCVCVCSVPRCVL